MSEAPADYQTETQPNGKPVAPAVPNPAAGDIPGLPPGTVRLSPLTHQTVVRLIQAHQGVQDVLWAFLDAKEARGPHSLVIPVILLVPPQTPPEGQQGA